MFLGFIDDSRYDDRIEELLRILHSEPKYKNPKLGDKPEFN